MSYTYTDYHHHQFDRQLSLPLPMPSPTSCWYPQPPPYAYNAESQPPQAFPPLYPQLRDPPDWQQRHQPLVHTGFHPPHAQPPDLPRHHQQQLSPPLSTLDQFSQPAQTPWQLHLCQPFTDENNREMPLLEDTWTSDLVNPPTETPDLEPNLSVAALVSQLERLTADVEQLVSRMDANERLLGDPQGQSPGLSPNPPQSPGYVQPSPAQKPFAYPQYAAPNGQSSCCQPTQPPSQPLLPRTDCPLQPPQPPRQPSCSATTTLPAIPPSPAAISPPCNPETSGIGLNESDNTWNLDGSLDVSVVISGVADVDESESKDEGQVINVKKPKSTMADDHILLYTLTLKTWDIYSLELYEPQFADLVVLSDITPTCVSDLDMHNSPFTLDLPVPAKLYEGGNSLVLCPFDPGGDISPKVLFLTLFPP